MNKYAVASFSVLALSATTAAMAAQDPTKVTSVGLKSSWYFGLGMGRTSASIPGDTLDGIASSLGTANGANFAVVNKKKTSTGVKAFVGYSFNPFFALEGGYAYLGKSKADMDFRANGVPTSTSVGSFNIAYKMRAVFIDGVGTLPIGEKWNLFGRVGLSYNKVSTDFNGEPLTLLISDNDRSKNKFGVKFGAGAGYGITQAVALRAEWEEYRMPDPLSGEKFSEDVFSLSVLFSF
ncbi:MAG: outer membrane beta-barrel protein [Betaproteobacteria bacterium]